MLGLGIIVSLGLIDARNGKCFEVGADINSGALVLLLAALTSVISTQVITRFAEAAIEDRQNRAKASGG